MSEDVLLLTEKYFDSDGISLETMLLTHMDGEFWPNRLVYEDESTCGFLKLARFPNGKISTGLSKSHWT